MKRYLFVALLMLVGCKEETKLSITGVDPKQGQVIGGDPVTIKGTGFQGKGAQGFTVYFGKAKATNCIIQSNTAIRCDAPAGPEGTTVDVEVEFDDARKGKLTKAFTYMVPTGPGGAEAIAPGGPKAPAPAPPQ
jgi:hypothetical protein